MKIFKRKNRLIAGFLAVALALLLGAGFPAVEAKAASGNVYTCTINRCYAHPVTGEIEDSGGEASYATGQGMVEGCVYADGILEVTGSGEYYLTIRMSLMDYTSDHSFLVQNVGDSSWSTPAMGQTGSGTDTNGTTADICIQVPSENCVVRGTMYVEPMGRYVIFYFYPSNYSAGNSTDMNATIVTSASGSDASTSTGSTTTTGSTSTGSTSTGSSTTTSGLSSGSSSQLQSSATDDTESTESTDESSDSTAPALSSSITEAATPSTTTDSDDDDTLDSAEGLSLSTEDAAASGDTATAETVTKTTPTKTIITWVAAVTVGILIVVAVVAVIVYFFRKNWNRWGGGEDDYEE